jgi:hypothetical protein
MNRNASIQSRAQLCASTTATLRTALAAYCNADGRLEAAWSLGVGDMDTLQAASDAAAAALQSAYTPCYRAFKAAADTRAAHTAASVLAEAEKVARQSVLTLTR